ncbi:Ryncolin-4,Fibrinogen C domain-containing protein 1-A,Techylectin-5B,Angiopoietin-related protein 2,Microfibril-associated glycoprotein 4,Techylectin-5A,Ficolin-2,Ficolin-1,Fibrinogen C domain-containing protein 1-B,Fibrinogen C domain-containing protein 1 [Mytilus coruscus]|uniref:Fibrinogen C-terminal domain-containing protein n=1 Tax=Mytilus coruscus TaxID=42192 RepID=A0A6J8DE14_MYTCO|nr:Ryncolin-4,Fibrinogen C domain-containing protein 1-A,Techylectin-5B,Angiopoietin-related protein 2,Microfibril-associated glycoprotein 4,Techylectin-5A,Ficolin-2,Ficolin-1,Fibrinogen C domain-containing protein 1-B,Fibrinogen C domain-containing protein 1 [Mytilus coruscus]
MEAEGGQECLSCTAVESANDCNHRIQCDDNELCYMHHYVTESGTSGFDFGCDSQQACSRSFDTIFGRRSEGHHVKCTLCCDDSKICNEDLNCTSTVQTRNDIIHAITADSNHAMMILMTDYNNVTKYGEYLSFHVDNEENAYRLMLGKYTGNAGDSLTLHEGQKFSTYDKDNDVGSGSCAQGSKGAWWYRNCHASNLNGLYLRGQNSQYALGVVWNAWHGFYYSLKTTTMMIRKY